jgi:hypothetical protein
MDELKYINGEPMSQFFNRMKEFKTPIKNIKTDKKCKKTKHKFEYESDETLISFLNKSDVYKTEIINHDPDKKDYKDKIIYNTKMQKNKLEYVVGENMTSFMRKANNFKADVQDDIYVTILQFINEIMDLDGKFKYESLRDFKRIKHVDIVTNIDINKKILIKYIDQFDKIGYELSKKDINKMDEDFIIHVIGQLLSKINYHLHSKKYPMNVREQQAIKESYYKTNKLVSETEDIPKLSKKQQQTLNKKLYHIYYTIKT